MVPPASFDFVVLGDPHFHSPQCPGWFEKLGARLRALDPELLLVLGDLSEHGAEPELELMRQVLEGWGIPWRTVIGNHDCRGHGDRSAFDRHFPDATNFSFRHRGWQFVGLDTTDGPRWADTRVPDSTLAWLDQHPARLDPAAPTVVFTHFPLGPGVPMRPLNADELLARLDALRVAGIFSGHYHGFTERARSLVPILTPPCAAIARENHDGSHTKGFLVCRAHADGHLSWRCVEVVA